MLKKLRKLYPIELAQVPANLLDQRIKKYSLVDQVASEDIEIHVRSAFLQGVLLKDLDQLPSYFSKNKQLRLLQDFVRRSGIPRLVLALNYLKQCPAIDKILVGVLTRQELLECLDAYHTPLNTFIDFDMFECSELDLVNPSRWPSLL
jgi:aryl-alcohol dehydrogenase-like predicted oxidoreductase